MYRFWNKNILTAITERTFSEFFKSFFYPFHIEHLPNFRIIINISAFYQSKTTLSTIYRKYLRLCKKLTKVQICFAPKTHKKLPKNTKCPFCIPETQKNGYAHIHFGITENFSKKLSFYILTSYIKKKRSLYRFLRFLLRLVFIQLFFPESLRLILQVFAPLLQNLLFREKIKT